jgi:uncharacterized protein YdhG (YjbR/CyaY superfamily)
MKKAKSSARRFSPKATPTPETKTVETYLDAVQEPARSTLNKVRAVIRSVVPAEATEAISYGIPSFKYRGSLVWYAAFLNHCSLFPGSKAVIKMFEKELEGYGVSKGTIQFPVDKPLPTPLLKKIVKARLAENAHRKQS